MAKFVVYTRVSIENYLMKKQDDAIKEQKNEILKRLRDYDEYNKEFYSDKGIESLSSQPELTKAIDNMQFGDTLVILSLDKLGLPLTDLIEFFIKLNKKDIDFISLEEGINTKTHGELLYDISNSLIKCGKKIRSEHGKLPKRNKNNLKSGGRKLKLDKESIKTLLRRHFIDNERPAKLIYMDLEISKTTFYNYVKEYKNNYMEFLEDRIS